MEPGGVYKLQELYVLLGPRKGHLSASACFKRPPRGAIAMPPLTPEWLIGIETFQAIEMTQLATYKLLVTLHVYQAVATSTERF